MLPIKSNVTLGYAILNRKGTEFVYLSLKNDGSLSHAYLIVGGHSNQDKGEDIVQSQG